MNKFPAKIDQFKEELVKLIVDETVSNQQKENFVQITNITAGSVRVQGTMATTTVAAMQNTLSKFNTVVATGASFSGIEVLASKTTINTPLNGNTTTSTSSSNVGMIVGIVVGGVAALLIAAVVTVYFCKRNKNQTPSQQNLDEKKSANTEQ